MNRKNYLIFSGILILCIIGFVYYKLQYSKDIFAQIVSKVGEVNLVDENGELLKKIETGYKIKTGEFLETKDDSSATIKFVDNSIAIISEKSLVEMKKLKYDEASKQSITNLLLLKGKVESTVTNQDTFGSEYKVITPTLQLAVRGTIFNVIVEGDESRAFVTEGKIVASDGNKSLTLNAGYGVVVNDKIKLDSPIKLLNKPTVDLNELSIKYYKKYISWKELENAVKYHVQIYAASKYNSLIHDKYVSGTELNIDDLKDGKYKISIQAVDKYGLEGFKIEEDFEVKSNPLPPKIKSAKINEQTRMTLFNWEKSQEANKYILEISRTRSFENVLIRVTNLKSSLNSMSLPLQKGNYFIRMSSIDDAGIRGPYSQMYPFKVEKR
ncbi:FecR domain-containing protein [Halarcobacter sp.]|uniref:FecR family protein n=1 Tax=Halarcobacter sp. TaxID=2321133 RepID=UPI003B00BB31